jgi:N-succinyldiaminopimelate aminotransferase
MPGEPDPVAEVPAHGLPHPKLSPETVAMPGAVYSPFADRIADRTAARAGGSGGIDTDAGDPLFPLHVGDTWRDPFVGARSEDLSSAEIPRLHAYSDTRGVPALVSAVGAKLRDRNGLDHGSEEILITAGATGGLATLAGAALSPGDEILILAPFWPLIRGIAQSYRAKPVEVPFFDRVATREEAIAAIEARITPRSRVLYVSTPSNPTGRIIPPDWLEAMAALARRHDLWVFSDEVYEDYVYAGEHVSMARFARERTVSVFSFSKSYAMAGSRVGYLAGPRVIVDEARKIGTHLYYHAPVSGQYAALAALIQGGDWLAANRRQDGEVGRRSAALLGLPAPEGGTFLFLDVRDRLDARGLYGYLEDAFAQGVLVAPGHSCGEDYAEWVRLSFTAAVPERVLEAVRRLAELERVRKSG